MISVMPIHGLERELVHVEDAFEWRVGEGEKERSAE